MGLRLGAIDLGLGRAYELRVSRAQGLGFRLGLKVRNCRFRVRAGLVRVPGKVGKEFAQFRLWGQVGEKMNFH